MKNIHFIPNNVGRNDRSNLLLPPDTASFRVVVLGVKQTGEKLIYNIQ